MACCAVLCPGGEVPGLFTPEELAKELAPLDSQRDVDASYTGPPNTYAYFTHRCVAAAPRLLLARAARGPAGAPRGTAYSQGHSLLPGAQLTPRGRGTAYSLRVWPGACS